jgi:predicted ABC-class ATPase
MEDYEPSDATPRAREVTSKFPPRAPLGDGEMRAPRMRRVRASSIDLRRGRRETARGRGLNTIELGRERVDLSYLEQLAEAGQTEAIARLIGELAAAGKSRGVKEVVEEALASISESGLDSLGNFKGHPGELSLPRAQEVAAAINRIRSLEVRPDTD